MIEKVKSKEIEYNIKSIIESNKEVQSLLKKKRDYLNSDIYRNKSISTYSNTSLLPLLIRVQLKSNDTLILKNLSHN